MNQENVGPSSSCYCHPNIPGFNTVNEFICTPWFNTQGVNKRVNTYRTVHIVVHLVADKLISNRTCVEKIQLGDLDAKTDQLSKSKNLEIPPKPCIKILDSCPVLLNLPQY